MIVMNIEGEIDIMVYIYTSNIEHLLEKKIKSGEKDRIVLLARYESVGTEDGFFALNFSFVDEPDKKIRCYFMLEEGYNSSFITLMHEGGCCGEKIGFYIENLHLHQFEVCFEYDKYLRIYCAKSIKVWDTNLTEETVEKKQLKGEENYEKR